MERLTGTVYRFRCLRARKPEVIFVRSVNLLCIWRSTTEARDLPLGPVTPNGHRARSWRWSQSVVMTSANANKFVFRSNEKQLSIKSFGPGALTLVLRVEVQDWSQATFLWTSHSSWTLAGPRLPPQKHSSLRLQSKWKRKQIRNQDKQVLQSQHRF